MNDDIEDDPYVREAARERENAAFQNSVVTNGSADHAEHADNAGVWRRAFGGEYCLVCAGRDGVFVFRHARKSRVLVPEVAYEPEDDEIRATLADERVALGIARERPGRGGPRHRIAMPPKPPPPVVAPPEPQTKKYDREPSGRGWRAVIGEFMDRNPDTKRDEVVGILGCKPTTAATYIAAWRDLRRRSAGAA